MRVRGLPRFGVLVRLPGRDRRVLPMRRGLRLRTGVHLPCVPAGAATAAGAAVMADEQRLAVTAGVFMPYVIGFLVSAAVAAFARIAGFERDRSFYPTVLIVTASYYILFAAMGGSMQTVLAECAVMAVFVLAAVAGYRVSAWVVVAGLLGHGVFDVLRGHVIENAGVPVWWPGFCLGFDAGAAACVAWVIRRGLGAREATAAGPSPSSGRWRTA